MSKVAKWRQFSENEIKDFIESSNNLKEAFQKMGYKNYCPKTFQNIIALYPNLKPEKRLNNNRVYWKKFSKSEIFNKAKNSTSQEDFLKQMGYTTCRPNIFKEIMSFYPELKEIFPWSKEAIFKKYSFKEIQELALQSKSGAEFFKRLGYEWYKRSTMEEIKNFFSQFNCSFSEVK